MILSVSTPESQWQNAITLTESTLMLERIQLKAKKWQGTQIGVLLVASLLPLFFNPFSYGNFEPTRVVLFLVIVLGMLLFRIAAQAATLSPSPGSDHHAETRRLNLVNLWRSNPLAIPALVYGLVYLISTTLSTAPRVSWFGNGNLHGMIATFAIVTFFLLAANALRSWEELHRLITVLLCVSVAVVVYGFAQYLGLDPLKWRTATLSPVQSTLGLSIACGAYLVLVLPFSLARVIGQANRDRGRSIAYGMVVVLQLTCLVFTLARGPVLGWAIGSVVFCWLVTQRLPLPHRIGLVLAVAAVGILMYAFVYKWGVLAFPGNATTLARLEQARGASNDERVALWRSALHLIPGSLLFGYGPETFNRVYLSQNPALVDYEVVYRTPLDPHNIFLYQLLSAGICGLAAFLWLLLVFYRITISALHRTTDKHQRAVIAGIIASATGYLVQAQFHPDVIVPWSLLWLVFAMGATTNRLVRGNDVDSWVSKTP